MFLSPVEAEISASLMDLSSAANRFELKQRKRADHAMNPRKRCRRNAVNELQEKLFSRTEPNLSRRWFYFEMFDKMVEMETILPGSHEEVSAGSSVIFSF